MEKKTDKENNKEITYLDNKQKYLLLRYQFAGRLAPFPHRGGSSCLRMAVKAT